VSRFLDTHKIEVKEKVPASRKLGKSEAAAIARGASTIYVAKGTKLDQFEGGRATDEVVSKMLGPTGNLRSPLLRVGSVVVVGYDEKTLTDVLS
jgi:hypothetical protein